MCQVYNTQMIKLNAKQLRKYQVSGIKYQRKRNDIYIILDDILDTYNIGSIFRIAEAVGAKKIYLCKGSATPPDHKIKKASINTTEIVDWEYFENTEEAIKDLRFKIKEIQVIAVEQSPRSIEYTKYDYKLPIALVVGHETTGVSKEVLTFCDGIVEIPMFGINISLNVMVSLAVVMYKVIEKTKI